MTRLKEIEKEIEKEDLNYGKYKSKDYKLKCLVTIQFLEGEKKGILEGIEMVEGLINTNKNPYPKDIFLWNGSDKLEFGRGRFNQHCYEIVENMRRDLLEEIKTVKNDKT